MDPLLEQPTPADVASLRAENERLLNELEWAYGELAQSAERTREESQVAYAEVRDTVLRLERRVAELSTLNEIGRALSATLRLDQVLEIIGSRLRSVLPGKLFGVAVVTGVSNDLDLRVLAGEAAIVPGSRDAMLAVVEWIARRGETLRLAHPGDGASPQLADTLQSLGVCRSWLGVPLLAGDDVVGALAVADDEPYDASGDDERLLSSVAIQAAVAVANARLYEEIMRRTAELGAVLEMSQALSSAWTESESLMEVLARRTQELIPSDSFGIFLFDDSRASLSPVVYHGPDAEAVMSLRISVGEGIIGLVARTGQPELVNHAHLDPRSKHVPGTEVSPECMLAVPLRTGETTMGVLVVSREGDRIYRSADLDFLTVVASHAAVALENARLFDNLQRALAENKRAQQQLLSAERLRALGEMASGVAHDFNNILGAILGRAQLLLMRTQDEQARKGLSVIEQAARDGAATVKKIQDFTRLSQPPAPEPVDPNAAARDVVEMTRTRWEQSGGGGSVEVTLDLQATHEIYANASEVREVLTNLLLNAVDACVAGGVICVRSRTLGDAVELTVHDTGCGMTPEVRERMFQPFFTTKGKKGTGLGLAVSHGIVARYGGTLNVESEPNVGSVFTITFPAHDPIGSTPGPSGDDLLPVEQLHGSFIVVDDEKEVATVVAEFLRGAGHEVRMFLSARDALAGYREHASDGVFTDLGMPEMDGWQLTQGLLEHDPHARVVIVSGWGLQLTPERMRGAGVFAVLAKPLSVDRAQSVAQDVLRAASRNGAECTTRPARIV